MALTLDSVMTALRSLKITGIERDLIAAGRVRNLKLEGTTISFKLVLPHSAEHEREKIDGDVKRVLTGLGAKKIDLSLEFESGQPASGTAAEKHSIPGVKHIIAVSSGKGGVGKSTVAANLACALAKNGAAVGLLDTDVYGPNIPTMMGVTDVPEARMDETRGEMLLPLESYGVKVMSMGMLARGDQPLVWRGPMLHSVVNQFLMKVDWGTIDYLVVDMPPGTGDVQLSLTQLVAVSGAVVVTTPQEVSLQDVRKAIIMFEKVGVPVLGVVENMSYFICDSCSKRHNIFGTDGGKLLAEKFKVPLLTQLPLAGAVREAGDAGAPIVVREPGSEQGKLFVELARKVADSVERQGKEAAGPTIGTF